MGFKGKLIELRKPKNAIDSLPLRCRFVLIRAASIEKVQCVQSFHNTGKITVLQLFRDSLHPHVQRYILNFYVTFSFYQPATVKS